MTSEEDYPFEDFEKAENKKKQKTDKVGCKTGASSYQDGDCSAS